MNDKYKLFNDMNVDDFDYEQYPLSENDKENIFNSINLKIKQQENIKKYKYKKLAIASLLCICISSVVLSNDKVWAMVENIGQQIEELLGKPQKEYDGFKIDVNQSVIDSNLTVNLTEALLNDGEIMLSLGIDSSKFDDSDYKNIFYYKLGFEFNSPTIYVDDMKFVPSSSWGGYESRNGKLQEFIYSYSLSSIDTNGDDMPEIDNYELLDSIDPNKDYEVKIVFDELSLVHMGKIPYLTKDKYDTVDGTWEFEFTVNGKNIKDKTQVFEINEEIEVENEKGSGKILIDSVRVSPVSARIKYQTIQSSELTKSIDYSVVPHHLGIELFDQDGNDITGGGGSSSDDLITFDCEMNTLLDNYKDLTSIKIVPYVYSIEKDSRFYEQMKKISFEDKAIEIKLNK